MEGFQKSVALTYFESQDEKVGVQFRTDFTAEILGSLVHFYNMKLEYSVFSSTYAIFLPAALHPSMPCFFSDRPIPQLHLKLLQTTNSSSFFANFIMILHAVFALTLA